MSTCTLTGHLRVETKTWPDRKFESGSRGKLTYRLLRRSYNWAEYLVTASGKNEVEASDLLCEEDHALAVGPFVDEYRPYEHISRIVPARFTLKMRGLAAVLAADFDCELHALDGPDGAPRSIDVEEAQELVKGPNPEIITATLDWFRDGWDPLNDEERP